jgi:hypothetical protein
VADVAGILLSSSGASLNQSADQTGAPLTDVAKNSGTRSCEGPISLRNKLHVQISTRSCCERAPSLTAARPPPL